MTRFAALLGPALVLAFLSTADTQSEGSPEQSFRAASAALPAPSARVAFEFEGDVVINGAVVGECLFAATPRKKLGGEAVWSLTEAFSIGRPRGVVHEALAEVGRDLVPLEGSLKTNEGGKPRVFLWMRAGKKLRVVTADAGGELVERGVEAGAPSVTTLTSAILFARMVPPDDTAYETRDFDPASESPYSALKLTGRGPGEWLGEPALFVKGSRGGAELTLAFHPTTRAFLGLRMREDGVTLDFVARGFLASSLADDVFAAPASSPAAAALKIALALATADLELFDRTTHWESVRAHLGDDFPADTTLAAFRGKVLEDLKASVTPQPRAASEDVLRGIEGQLVVDTKSASEASVTFPESFGYLTLSVRRVDGTWRLAALPGS